MTARENALRIIDFNEPERVTSGPPVYWLRYTGVDHEGYDDDLGDDHPVGTRWTDVWGTGWHKEHPGVMGLSEVHPLADVASLADYAWPDPDDEKICGRIHRLAGMYEKGDQFLGGRHRDTLWEKAYMLVGMETLMVYFHTEPEFVREVLHRIMDFQLGVARHYADQGVEFVALGDDLGTQTGPLLGPRIVEDFLLPEYRRLCGFYAERNVRIIFHSCGDVSSVLNVFMDLGVDVLNPVQATANNLGDIRIRTADRMALQGGVPSAIGVDGTPDDVRNVVRERIRQLGAAGGYFCTWDQAMPFKPENVAALEEAIAEYGRY